MKRNIQVYQAGQFYFAFQSQEFSKGSHPVELSHTDQKLLKILVENRGSVLSRADLTACIWEEEQADENALSAAVKRLRDKLEDNPSAPRYIKTVYGIGYTWSDERAQGLKYRTHG